MAKNETKYVQLSIPDNDELFSRATNAILINDILVDARLGDILKLVYDDDSDNPSVVASCPSGCTVGSYYAGTKCEYCGEMVSDDKGTQIRHDVWFSSPPRIGQVLHPEAYRVLSTWMGRIDNVKLLDAILNRGDVIPERWKTIITGQGFIWFRENFEFVIEQIMAFKKGSKNFVKNLEITLFLETHGDRIWCTKFPLVSRILHPLVRSAGNRYVSKETDSLVKTINNLAFSALSETLLDTPLRTIERKFWIIYKEFNAYLENILRSSVVQKTAIARKHVFGSRVFNTVRTVCVPIIEPHDLDEVHIAWSPAVKLLETMIIAMLVNSNRYTHFQAYQKVERAISVYDFEIDKLIQKIIKDSKYGGVPIILNRNPVLSITGLMLLRLTRVYPCCDTDPEKEFQYLRKQNPDMSDEELLIPEKLAKLTSVKTVALSPGILSGPNID